MNVKRQGLSLLIAAMLLSLICCFSFTANAAEVSGTQDGLVASITSEKDSYKANEDIELTFKVTNTNDFAVENVSLEAIIPDGLTLKNKADTNINTVSLGARESLELNLTAVKESADVTAPTDENVQPSTENSGETRPVSTEATESAITETTISVVGQAENSENTTSNNQSAVTDASNTNGNNGSDNTSVKTGANTSYLVLALICLACIVVAIVAFRFRKHSVKYLSLVLCACIVAGSVTAIGIPKVSASKDLINSFSVDKTISVDSTEYKLSANVKYTTGSADSNIVTKGQWVDMLVNEFSMNISDAQKNEVPFDDLENSAYRDSVTTAYYNAVLPADADNFYPDTAATRDFAVYTLNNCLCYIKNSDLVCDDFDSIQYKDAASALVERGYFSLIDNKFMPETAVTKAEMSTATVLIKAAKEKMQVDENYEDVIELNDDAVVLDSSAVKSIDGNKVIMNNNSQTTALKSGDVFFAPDPSNLDLTVAYKIESIDVSEDKITLTVSEPQFEEMYKTLDIEGVVKTQPTDVSGKSAMNSSVGAGIFQAPNFNYGDTVKIDAEQLKFNNTYKIDSGDGDKIEVKLNGGLESPELEYKAIVNFGFWGIKDDFEFYVALKNKLNFYGEASVEFGKGKSGRLTIAEIPIPICPGVTAEISVDLVVSASGKISIEYSLQNQIGALVDKNGLQFKKEFSEPEFLPKAELEASVGLSPGVELKVANSKVVGTNAEIGAKLTGKAELLKDKKIHTDLSGYMYFNASIDTDGFLKEALEFFKCNTEKTFEIISKDNTPISADIHLEGMEIINECTYRYAEGKITKESDIPLDGVTVEIYADSSDTTPVCTTETNDLGEFGILIPMRDAGYPDELIFKFTKDGYTTIEQSFTIKTGTDTNLNTIQMKFSSGSAESIFETLPAEFIFSSGIGNWRTYIDIKNDGSFTGQYSDADMGDTGNGYPNGIVYLCDFEGEFSEPVQIDQYTYSMKLESIELEKTPGEEYIENGVKYICTEPSGLSGAEELLIYLPGIKMSDLPKEFKLWLPIDAQSEEFLQYYGIYNINDKSGFFAQDIQKISIEEASKIATGRIGDDDCRALYLKNIEYNDEEYYLFDIQRKVNHTDETFHY